MAEESGGEEDHSRWMKRLTELICANGHETLEVLSSTFREHVRSLPLSYLAIHSTRRTPLEIIGASTVFMEQFHYSFSEQLTFENIFVGPEEFVSPEEIERALKNPLHRAFSIPLVEGSSDQKEVLVYVAKRGVSTKDVPTAYFPIRKQERHYYLFLEMNQIGTIQRNRQGCFSRCSYEYKKRPLTPYDCMVKSQAQSIERINKKGDKPVIWNLPLINPEN